MKIVHRIGLRATASQRRELEQLGAKLPAGVVLPGGGDPLLAFDIDESHPNWSALAALTRQWKASDTVRTEFSKKEIETASWLDLVADWHHGYPQPDEDTFGYRRATYDVSNWCEQCGIGMKQRAPFQMKAEPRWSKNSILQLNWVFDEFFVTPDLWSTVFEPHGIGRRPVTDTKGAELRTVVQLGIEEEVGISTDGLASERCAKCGAMKYLPISRGPFPPLKEIPPQGAAKTKEYFGSGARAHKHVLVSQELARDLARAKARGASLRPVASVIDSR